MIAGELNPIFTKSEPEHREIVRLKTSYWMNDKRVLSMKKELIPVKRKSFGFQILPEDVANIGADLVCKGIVNLDTAEDGIYEVGLTNISRDWETGYLDDWNYILNPYKE